MTVPRLRPDVRRQLGVAALFVLLAVAHTWPLATAPGTLSRNDNADVVLNEWALAWVAHQVVADPAHLFDANIFFPEKGTLAYSEHLIPQALMVAPLSWAGVSPVAVHNMSLLLGMALTGWAMSWVVGRWTGSLAAGILAGAATAFNAHTLTRLSHVQAQHVEFLPLALLALDRLLAEPRLRHAMQTAVWFALQAMASGYFLVFSIVALLVATMARPGAWLGRNVRRLLPFGVLSGVTAIVLLWPTLWPYWKVRTDAGLVRPLSEVALFSANWTDYLATGGRLHFELWSRPFFRADALFPGVIVLLLVVVAVISRTALRDPRCRMCLAVAVVAAALSFGAKMPGYEWLYTHVALLQGVRGAARFGQLALAMLAVVAAYGLAFVLGRVRNARLNVAIATVVILVATGEALRSPLAYPRFGGIPKIYDTLASEPHALLVHFPMYSPQFIQMNASYMLGSTRHWFPMLNGYSGFVPQSYRTHRTELGGFPDERALWQLWSLGVTHVVVDETNVAPDRAAAIRACPKLTLRADEGPLRIYALQK